MEPSSLCAMEADNEKCRIYCSDKSTYRESQLLWNVQVGFRVKTTLLLLKYLQGKILQGQSDAFFWSSLFIPPYLIHPSKWAFIYNTQHNFGYLSHSPLLCRQNLYCLSANLLHFMNTTPFYADVF